MVQWNSSDITRVHKIMKNKHNFQVDIIERFIYICIQKIYLIEIC